MQGTPNDVESVPPDQGGEGAETEQDGPPEPTQVPDNPPSESDEPAPGQEPPPQEPQERETLR